MKKKPIILTVIIIAVIAAAFGLWYYGQKQDSNIIHYKDPGFTQDETQSFENQLSDVQNKLNNLGKDASAQDKFSLYMQLGVINYSLGRYDDAKAAYKQAAGLLKDNATPWHELYVVENAMHDYAAAKISIEKALSLNNSNAQFWLDRISLMKAQFHYTEDQVDSLYKDALNATHNAVDIITAYAKFLEEKSDLAGAVKYWKMAIDLNPTQKQVYEQEVVRLQSMLQ